MVDPWLVLLALISPQLEGWSDHVECPFGITTGSLCWFVLATAVQLVGNMAICLGLDFEFFPTNHCF